jgi:hypothetical protein
MTKIPVRQPVIPKEQKLTAKRFTKIGVKYTSVRQRWKYTLSPSEYYLFYGNTFYFYQTIVILAGNYIHRDSGHGKIFFLPEILF